MRRFQPGTIFYNGSDNRFVRQRLSALTREVHFVLSLILWSYLLSNQSFVLSIRREG